MSKHVPIVVRCDKWDVLGFVYCSCLHNRTSVLNDQIAGVFTL